MRKGLISFTMLCMLISLTAGCQNNTVVPTSPSVVGEEPTSPDKTDAQTTVSTPAFTEPDTEDREMTENQEAGSFIPTVHPDPTESVVTEPVIQATEPSTTVLPQTEPTKETAPPVTEEPEHTESQHTQPKPTEPAITEPATTEPPVTSTPATEPPTTESAEVINLDALIQYGLTYAAETYGYEITPGLRNGYYPAYSCIFDTMEDGKTAVRECIDDTTNALLSVPGTQIVAEIDGVLCRARIDIVIIPEANGEYLLTVYYG